jgi:hypothetical protein
VIRLLHSVFQLAVTAVPAAGWFVQNWSAGTTLVVYWFETVAGCLLVLVFLVVDLVVDLPRIRRWLFLRIEQTAERVMGRIVVVHLTLILGSRTSGPRTGATRPTDGDGTRNPGLHRANRRDSPDQAVP